MRGPVCALFLGVAAMTLAAVGSALGAGAVRHTGTIVTVDPVRHVLTLDEMGPWAPKSPKVVRRSIQLTPSTRVEVVRRATGAGDEGWRGGFTESRIPLSGLEPGDFATVAVEGAGRHLRAVTVEVVRPERRAM